MGTKHYPESFKLTVIKEHSEGHSVKSLSKKYGVSKWAIHCWCGLSEKVNQRKMNPQKRGRPRKNLETLEEKVKRLEMENELLRNFLQELERK